MNELKHIDKAENLPLEWDEMAGNYFRRKAFLIHNEKYNPCRQRYYLLQNEGVLLAGAIVYTLRLDILTYLKLKSPIKMNIIGVPCSVSSAGVFGGEKEAEELVDAVYRQEKGFMLSLNLRQQLKHEIASGKTLPTIVLENKFADWEDYLKALRSSYRRRIRIINKDKSIEYKKLSCSDFTPEMHAQYIAVYQRSKGKLEKLTYDFFKNLPSDFILTLALKGKVLLGWNLALESKDTYYFFLGGVDYKQNRENNTYLRLLSILIKDGIEKKVKYIDLGQTAEIPKMRMGGKPQTLFMEAKHSNSFFNALLKRFSSKLEYKVDLENNNTMKNQL